MEFSRKQISIILEALKARPRGMNVSEVSRATGMNRSTVSKYLEMLYVSGQADRRTFGTSKLYYISQRMPISAFLNVTSNLMIILDKEFRVLNANDSFFEFTGTRREDIVHKYFDNFAFPMKFNPSIMPYIEAAAEGREASIESYYPKKEGGRYFNIKLIPLLFDDGDKGVTVIFEDITEKKLAEKALLKANFELETKVKERTKELEKANEALRKSEAYLLEAEQIAHLGYWSYDIKTRESRASDETLRLFGLVRGTRWSRELFRSMVHPEDMQKIENADKEAMSRGTPVDYEYRIVLSDGSERFIRSVRGIRRGKDGEPIELFGTIQDITEKKGMEIALKESEERHRMITEKSYDVVFSVKPDGTISYVSPQIAYYGYDSGQLYGKKLFEFIPASYRDFIAAKFRETMISGECPPIEFKFLRKDGTEQWAEVTAKAIYDEAGKPLFNVGTVRDIEERKKAEEALRNSELKFKTLFEGASTAIFIIDLKTRAIVDCNTYGSRLVGRSKDELIGKHHSTLHPAESAGPCRQNVKIHAKDGNAVNYETELVHKDGHRIPVLINSTIMEVEGKKLMIGSYLEITERKRAEEALMESEARFNQVLDSLTDSFMILDSKWRCLFVNEATIKTAGMSKEQVLGRSIWELYPRSVGSAQYEQAMKTMEDKIPRTWINSSSVNGVWYEYRAYPWDDGIALFARDITERKLAEEALKDSEEKFRALADSSNIGILLVQGEETVYANQALADMFGYTVEECCTIKFWEPVAPDMKEFIRHRIMLRQRGEPGPSRIELRMVRKNGEPILVDCTDAVLQYRRKPAMMLTAIDITTQKMMEQELKKSVEKFRDLVENSPLLVWDVNENYRCTYVSPKSRESLGYEPEEVLGKTPFDFISPDDLERVQALVKPYLDEHKPFEVEEYFVVRKDGEKIIFRTVATPMFDDKGQFSGYRGINRQLLPGE
ncbi:putative signaling protein [Methanocella paludicola SANAE]|uniref:histidine kinase n=1 Tax=Methanocella paludicola (strain DSM 17711 / JCM 13418 / NBRC 101707 / SANAE) TaxID=304371 RepID=D1Z0P0_METPS|nr:PAS domain S-box protein [Methanocella paludicola]BAI62262.1 putative signaling protein [Methanocella paludicola SANAE]